MIPFPNPLPPTLPSEPLSRARVERALEAAKITRAAARAAEADVYEAAAYNAAMMSLVVAEQLLTHDALTSALRQAELAREQFILSAQRAVQRVP